MRRCSGSGNMESGRLTASNALEIVVVRASSATTTPETTFPAWFVYAFSANAEDAYRRIIVETIDLPIISTVL